VLTIETRLAQVTLDTVSRRDPSTVRHPAYTVAGDTPINGSLTLGENTADNGGLRLALMAYLAGPGKTAQPSLDGFTPEQRVFLGWAQQWCEISRPDAERLKAATNPHSANIYRVSGVVSNLPELATAFSCGRFGHGSPSAPVASGSARCRGISVGWRLGGAIARAARPRPHLSEDMGIRAKVSASLRWGWAPMRPCSAPAATPERGQGIRAKVSATVCDGGGAPSPV
jgi:hypothetical protein